MAGRPGPLGWSFPVFCVSYLEVSAICELDCAAHQQPGEQHGCGQGPVSSRVPLHCREGLRSTCSQSLVEELTSRRTTQKHGLHTAASSTGEALGEALVHLSLLFPHCSACPLLRHSDFESEIVFLLSACLGGYCLVSRMSSRAKRGL